MLCHGVKGQLVALGLCMTLAGSCTAAEIYRWTDANGKIHFGDRPDGPAASAIKLAPSGAGPGTATDRNQRTERLLQEFAGDRAQREADRQHARELADKRSERCQQAKTQATELNEATYLYDRDKDGAKRILSEAELRKARTAARDAVAGLCD